MDKWELLKAYVDGMVITAKGTSAKAAYTLLIGVSCQMDRLERAEKEEYEKLMQPKTLPLAPWDDGYEPDK